MEAEEQIFNSSLLVLSVSLSTVLSVGERGGWHANVSYVTWVAVAAWQHHRQKLFPESRQLCTAAALRSSNHTEKELERKLHHNEHIQIFACHFISNTIHNPLSSLDIV